MAVLWGGWGRMHYIHVHVCSVVETQHCPLTITLNLYIGKADFCLQIHLLLSSTLTNFHLATYFSCFERWCPHKPISGWIHLELIYVTANVYNQGMCIYPTLIFSGYLYIPWFTQWIYTYPEKTRVYTYIHISWSPWAIFIHLPWHDYYSVGTQLSWMNTVLIEHCSNSVQQMLFNKHSSINTLQSKNVQLTLFK